MIGLAGVALLTCLAGSGGVYAWPLDLPQALTSSFGEYRTRKFHAGIDLRTGDIGKEVHAADDGYVSRVRSGPWGYGKAVYLTLKDGNVVVYGHLSDFYPALRDYVHKAQHAAHSYTVELTPKPDEFPVKRGQVVAKSGETGVGPPHLHYEIRDAQERPLNPHMLGITWPDTTPPIIRKVLVAPATPGDTVNGGVAPIILDAHPAGNNVYKTNPVHAKGRIGFGVDLIDPANENSNQLGVHILKTEAGGQEVFRVVHDRLSYDTIDNGAVSYHPFYNDKGHFLLQWRWPGNVCELFQQTKADGWYAVPASGAEVCITAEDFLVNTATVTIPILPDEAEPAAPPADAKAGQGKVHVDCVGTWLAITVEFTAPEPETPALVVAGAEANTPTFRRISGTTFQAGFAPAKSIREFTLHVTHARMKPYEKRIEVFHRGGSDATVTHEGVTARVRSNSPYGTLFLSVEPAATKAASGLAPVGRAFELWPDDSPIDAPVELSFAEPSGAKQSSRLRVYRNTGDGWDVQDTKRADGRLTVSTRRFGQFAVMEDVQAPTLSFIEPHTPQEMASARPPLNIKVADAGSGVAEVSATCDGQWILMEYDPERELAEWARDEDLRPGSHTVVFRAVDRTGNATTLKYELRRGSGAPGEGAKPHKTGATN